MNRLEDQFETLKDKVQQIDLQIHSKLTNRGVKKLLTTHSNSEMN
jgi:hypothetical protein